jgi:hypothetical protein
MPSLKIVWFVGRVPCPSFAKRKQLRLKRKRYLKPLRDQNKKEPDAETPNSLKVMKENNECSVPWIEKPLNGCIPALPSILFSMLYLTPLPRSRADAIVEIEQPFLDASF